MDLAQQLEQVKRARFNGPNQEESSLLDDHGRGGNHLAMLVHVVIQELKTKLVQGQVITEADTLRLDRVLAAVDHELDQGATLRLAVAGLMARSELAFTLPDSRLDPVKQRYVSSWPSRIHESLEQAPQRTDLAAPYLFWLLASGRDTEVLSFTQRLLAIDQNDPIAHWFTGLALLRDETNADAGLRHLRHALTQGVDRMIPLEDQWKSQLLGTSQLSN